MTDHDWGQFAEVVADLEARIASAPLAVATADQALASAEEFLVTNGIDPRDPDQLWCGLGFVALYLEGLRKGRRLGTICTASAAVVEGVYLGLLATFAPHFPAEARRPGQPKENPNA